MTRPDDAVTAERAGASFIGTVLVPSSPRRVTPEVARSIAEAVSIPLVVVVADLPARDAARAAEAAGARVIQLHGDEPPELVEALRDRGPWELWKAVRVRSGRDLTVAARSHGPVTDLLLLDGWHPSRLGGTGRVFAWDAVGSAREAVGGSVRVGIAGGLHPENVSDAIESLHPDLVDVSSGVESEPGVKDGDKVRAFVRRALDAPRDLPR